MKRICNPIRTSLLFLGSLMLEAVPLAFAQQHSRDYIRDHSYDLGSPTEPTTKRAASGDMRQAVVFPATLKEHTLASMRSHLQTLSEIQGYLAKDDFDRAADVAEKRLGMSSLPLHGAHEIAKYMPKGMQEAGTAMHRSASRFALIAQEASINRDLPRALAALNRITQSCVACHAGYRLK
jgi:hypothetical protein